MCLHHLIVQAPEVFASRKLCRCSFELERKMSSKIDLCICILVIDQSAGVNRRATVLRLGKEHHQNRHAEVFSDTGTCPTKNLSCESAGLVTIRTYLSQYTGSRLFLALMGPAALESCTVTDKAVPRGCPIPHLQYSRGLTIDSCGSFPLRLFEADSEVGFGLEMMAWKQNRSENLERTAQARDTRLVIRRSIT